METYGKSKEYRQPTLNFMWSKQRNKNRYSKILKGVTRKRQKILNRLSGARENNSKKYLNRTLNRIKKARNNQTHRHRMRGVNMMNADVYENSPPYANYTPPHRNNNNRNLNNLTSKMKNATVKGGA